jgi:hypothetical protein
MFAAAITTVLGPSPLCYPHPHLLRRLHLALKCLFNQAFAASMADHLDLWLTAASSG